MCITRANRTATASEQMRRAADERKMLEDYQTH